MRRRLPRAACAAFCFCEGSWQSFSLKHFDGENARDVPIEKPTGEVSELVDEITAMAAAVRDGAPLPASGEDGKWSVAMCLRAQESVETGRSVAFQASV